MWSIAIEQILLSATLAVPALALLYKRQLFPKLRSAWLFLICCLIVYGLILAHVYLIETRLESELNAFDLNGDGFFSGPELTAAQEIAMNRVISDTGRNFAPFTGIILAPILGAFAFALVKMVGMVRQVFQRYILRRT